MTRSQWKAMNRVPDPEPTLHPVEEKEATRNPFSQEQMTWSASYSITLTPRLGYKYGFVDSHSSIVNPLAILATFQTPPR